MGYGLDSRGIEVRSSTGVKDFFLLHSVQTGSEAHPASIQWVPVDLSLGVKRPGRESDHSPSLSAEVTYGGAVA
jgi:hypothetical protein